MQHRTMHTDEQSYTVSLRHTSTGMWLAEGFSALRIPLKAEATIPDAALNRLHKKLVIDETIKRMTQDMHDNDAYDRWAGK